VHGTGDGFDGVTVDLLGPAILVEQHRRWAACVDPLLKAVSTRLGKETPVYLKRRWSRAPGERGGCLVSGVRVKDDVDGVLADAARRAADEAAAKEGKDTHGDRVVVREPGQFGLKFGLWLTGEEHVGVFLDSRPARELVRSVSANKRVLNLFSYTGGFGAAASVGGAACSHNVDSKVSFILISVCEIRL
jgi:23S rRNA G2069 N7-methylase RlmK/C1962 C5-methylase RlmI